MLTFISRQISTICQSEIHFHGLLKKMNDRIKSSKHKKLWMGWDGTGTGKALHNYEASFYRAKNVSILVDARKEILQMSLEIVCRE